MGFAELLCASRCRMKMEVRVGRSDTRMPVISQNFPPVTVLDTVVVGRRRNLPWSLFPFCLPDMEPDDYRQKEDGTRSEFRSFMPEGQSLDIARIITAGNRLIAGNTG